MALTRKKKTLASSCSMPAWQISPRLDIWSLIVLKCEAVMSLRALLQLANNGHHKILQTYVKLPFLQSDLRHYHWNQLI